MTLFSGFWARMAFHHVPVMLEESVAAWRGVASALRPRTRVFIDCTVGGAGHTTHLLHLEGGARVLGMDKDPVAVAAASARLRDLRFESRATVLQASYSELPEVLATAAPDFPTHVDGIFADLGVSSPQLDDGARGFSLQHDGPLDMRFGPDTPASAADLVNTLPEAQLARLFIDLGEEPCAAAAARAVVSRRTARPFQSTSDLACVIGNAVRIAQRARFRSATTSHAHPATRCFQALRIAVNGELAALQRLLAAAPALLCPGGRFAVLTFHSLEDRLVKRAFATLCAGAAASAQETRRRRSSSHGPGGLPSDSSKEPGRFYSLAKIGNPATGTPSESREPPGHANAGDVSAAAALRVTGMPGLPFFRPIVFGSGTVGQRFASASAAEILRNPRSRSAKLRAVECLRLYEPGSPISDSE